MSIRISNGSVSVVARGYAIDPQEDVIVWLELCPDHPKAQGAIWASLVNNSGGWLNLNDKPANRCLEVRGLHSRYHRLTADAPALVVAGKPAKLLRLIAPAATHAQVDKPFYVLAWPGLGMGTALAAMLEADTPTPVLIGWGDYLLHEAIRHKYAVPLVSGGQAPQGYRIEPVDWATLISAGLRAGHITIN